MSKLLLDEKPIIVLPSLAKKVGLNEAIFLQQLNYWLQSSKHFYEGKKWIYNTLEDWKEQFPFWSISTIRRSIAKLENMGLLLSGNFNKSPIDQTKWYTINYEELEGLNNPSVQNEQMGNDPVVQNEQTLVQNEQSSCSNWTDQVFNLNRPIPENTTENTTDIKKEDEEDAPARAQKENPFRFYEDNGFGMISGYMHEKIEMWCNDLSDDLVCEAMKLAVENGKKTWRYVETILRSWAEKGIKTIDQVHAEQKAYREQQAKQRDKPKKRLVPVRMEMLPEWFVQRESPSQRPLDDEDDFDYEAERQRLEEELKKYRE